MKTKNNSVKRIAITQILLLIVGIFAVMWMIGSEVEVVSASDDEKGINVFELFSAANSAKIVYDYGVKAILKTPAKEEAGKVVEETVEQVVEKQGVEIVRESFGFKEFVFGTKETGEAWTGIGGGYETIGIGAEIGAGLTIAAWSGVAFLLGRYVIGPLLGLNVQQSQGLGYSLALGTATTLTLTSETLLGGATLGLGLSLGIGLGVALIVSIFVIQNPSADIIQYSCYSWDAEVKGDNCKLCTQQDLECTEYQCRSLGQACKFFIDEVSGEPSCVWENSGDIKAPIIKPRLDSLINKEEYRYSNNSAISPPDTGVKVQYTEVQDGCAPAWTPVSFGIELDEEARCKWSPGIIYSSYEEMPDLFLSGSSKLYNHTFQSSFPNTVALKAENENYTIENGGVYDIYVRCTDVNGNSNPSNFVFSFCIQEGPDKRPPEIVKTYPPSPSYFASGEIGFNISIYVNEPSDCKWSITDKDYELMENDFSCSQSIAQMNSENLFACTTRLDGLKDNQENNFYFRCKDQPNAEESLRNVNSVSFPYKLIGTQRLAIKSAKPNNTVISDSTLRIPVNIEVETVLGADDGKAICSLSETGVDGSFASFYYGQGVALYSQYQHKQTLTLPEGNYNYYIRCTDIGGNSDTTLISFQVETDTEPPVVVRAFKDDESGSLRIITNEEATCVYSNYPDVYDFEKDGTKMNTFSGTYDTEHYASWPEDAKTTYYIKCKDKYGKGPGNGETIIIRPFDIPDIRE